MKQVIITGSEKRINELKRYLSSYIKVKGLEMNDVEEITPKKSKKEGFVLNMDEDEKPVKKTTKKKV
jgi:inosine/xanthosine triphosphate pyrophosphatase family protein